MNFGRSSEVALPLHLVYGNQSTLNDGTESQNCFVTISLRQKYQWKTMRYEVNSQFGLARHQWILKEYFSADRHHWQDR